MIQCTDFAGRVQSVFEVETLIMAVDELLKLAVDAPLTLKWIDGAGRFQASQGESSVDFPMRGGDFRVILARLGKLCLDHTPDSVSLYGGEGRLVSGSTEFSVNFMNTQGEMWATVCRTE